MRAHNLLLAATLAVALGGVAVAPAANAAPGVVAGTWTSTDNDGSSQTLNVRGSGNNVYAMFLYDESATSACGGSPARLTGTGEMDGDLLVMNGVLTCLPGGNQLRFRIDFGFVYSSGSNTLTDVTGVVWHRDAD